MHAYEMVDKQTWGLRTVSDGLNTAAETPATELHTLPPSYSETVCILEETGRLWVLFNI